MLVRFKRAFFDGARLYPAESNGVEVSESVKKAAGLAWPTDAEILDERSEEERANAGVRKPAKPEIEPYALSEADPLSPELKKSGIVAPKGAGEEAKPAEQGPKSITPDDSAPKAGLKK